MSPRFWEMFGYGPHEKKHDCREWQDLIHPDDKQVALEALRAHTEEGKPYSVTVRYRHKKGHWVWVICRGFALKNSKGEYYRMVGCHQDVTDRKMVEADLGEARDQLQEQVEARTVELTRSESRYRDLYDNAPDMCLSVELASARIRAANKALIKASGYSRKEILSLLLFDLYPPECLDKVKGLLKHFAKIVGGHFKSGQAGPGQNRPVIQ